MSFVSFNFLLFIFAVAVIYYAVPLKYRNYLILPMNLVFYVTAGWEGPLWLMITAVVTWWMAVRIELRQTRYKQEKAEIRAGELDHQAIREKEKLTKSRMTRTCRGYLAAGIVLVVGIWAFFKSGKGSIAVPLAISYYTFMAVSYLADVYSHQYKAEHNFYRYLTWLTFFPQMVEGPFSRYDKQSAELMSPHCFRSESFVRGMMRILWGYSKKLVLADYLWMMISGVFAQDGTNACQTLLLILLLPLQQYADFSGCMDIALGTAGLIGIRLPENFRSPVFSKSVDEIWRRWHITLGAFCKDYIFYPVSLLKGLNLTTRKIFHRRPSVGKKIPAMIALLCVWTFMGLWHGFAWKYLIWGWTNLFFIAAGILLDPAYNKIEKQIHIQTDSRGWKLWCMIRTYLIFGAMELISDGPSASYAGRMFLSLFHKSKWLLIRDQSGITGLLPGISMPGTVAAVIISLFMLAVDILKEKQKDVFAILQDIPFIPRYLLYCMIFYMIVLFGPSAGNINAGFAYANF